MVENATKSIATMCELSFQEIILLRWQIFIWLYLDDSSHTGICHNSTLQFIACQQFWYLEN